MKYILIKLMVIFVTIISCKNQSSNSSDVQKKETSTSDVVLVEGQLQICAPIADLNTPSTGKENGTLFSVSVEQRKYLFTLMAESDVKGLKVGSIVCWKTYGTLMDTLLGGKLDMMFPQIDTKKTFNATRV